MATMMAYKRDDVILNITTLLTTYMQAFKQVIMTQYLLLFSMIFYPFIFPLEQYQNAQWVYICIDNWIGSLNIKVSDHRQKLFAEKF